MEIFHFKNIQIKLLSFIQKSQHKKIRERALVFGKKFCVVLFLFYFSTESYLIELIIIIRRKKFQSIRFQKKLNGPCDLRAFIYLKSVITKSCKMSLSISTYLWSDFIYNKVNSISLYFSFTTLYPLLFKIITRWFVIKITPSTLYQFSASKW